MFNHGTITAMLFIIVGVVYDRAHTRSMDAFGGLAKSYFYMHGSVSSKMMLY